MYFRSVITCALFVTGSALAQNAPKPAFEVASVKVSPPLELQKIMAAAQAGGRMPVGARINGARAEYTHMTLTQLIAIAYQVKPYQITGPDWLASQDFDIVAKLPDGASKEDIPRMLQNLLEERFQLSLHRETKENAVLALVLGKGGLKLKEAEAGKPIDEDAPLKPGEIEMDSGDGPMRMHSENKSDVFMDAGVNGKYKIQVNQSTMKMHVEASQMTMVGFVDILSQLSQVGNSGRRVVDLTGLKGSYDMTFDFSIAELMAMIRSQVGEGAGGGSDGVPKGASAASEPGGGVSLVDAVAALGLKLEPRKVQIEQLVIDRVEKTPSEN